MAVSSWSTSASSNATVGGVNIAENMARSDVNNAIRAVMAEAKAGFIEGVSIDGAAGDAVYNAGTKAWSGTDDTAALLAWAAAPGAHKVLPAGNYLFNSDRLAFASGTTLEWDADAWLCGGSACDTGAVWLSGVTGLRADRIQVDMRGAPWADSGAGQVNDAVTLVGCSDCVIDLIYAKGVYDSANVDATHCRGDSGLMLSQSTNCHIGTVIGEGLPDAVAYLNGNGQSGGSAVSPLDRCTIGRVVGYNCANGLTPKRAADKFRVGEVYLDGGDTVVSVEDVSPTVGAARDFRIDRVIGRNIKLNGMIARYSDRSSVGFLDIEFAARPGSLSGAAVRCGVDIQGTAEFTVENYRVIYDGSDGANQSAAVMIEERSGTVCSDIRVLGGYSDKAYWRVRENETTHLRTRVWELTGNTDGSTSPVSLQNSSGRYFHYHADNSLLLNTDLRFTLSNIGLYARDTDGTYRTLLVNALEAFLQSSGTTKAKVDSTGLYVVSGALGYGTGAGGTVTQATSKSTGVTLNKACGEIVMNNASLAATTSVAFTLTNSLISATDVVDVSIKSGATTNSYSVQVENVAAGSCRISLRNYTGGSLAEAVVLSFAVVTAKTA
jgi:hypothetical protein